MANFDNVTFANDVAALNGGSDASLSSLGDSEIQLVQNGSYASLPSPLNVAGEAFNVNYGPGVPNFTWDNAGNPIGVTAGDGKTWDIGVNNNWNSGTNATFYSDGTNVTFNDSNNGRYSVTLNATVQPASVTVSASGNYTISGSGSIAGSGSLAKSGGGTLTLFTSNTYTGGTTVSAGKLIVAASGALPDGSVAVTGGNLQLATGTGLAQVKSLSLTGSGSFDVTNNALSVADPGGAAHDSTFASLLGWVKSGAITSTAGLTGYGVGIVDGNDGVTDTPVSLNTIEVAYTLYGDANLDGKVDATDFSIFAPNFGLDVTTGWEAGDFNYDGKVDATDFSLFAPNFGLSATGAAISLPSADYAALDAFAAANGLSLTSVPEPAATTLLIAATGFLLRRSRFRA
jgi:autotransporter-associated beta strand protein